MRTPFDIHLPPPTSCFCYLPCFGAGGTFCTTVKRWCWTLSEGHTFGADLLHLCFVGRPLCLGASFHGYCGGARNSLNHLLWGKWFAQTFSVAEVIHLAILSGGSGSVRCVFASKWYWLEGVPLYILPPQPQCNYFQISLLRCESGLVWDFAVRVSGRPL